MHELQSLLCSQQHSKHYEVATCPERSFHIFQNFVGASFMVHFGTGKTLSFARRPPATRPAKSSLNPGPHMPRPAPPCLEPSPCGRTTSSTYWKCRQGVTETVMRNKSASPGCLDYCQCLANLTGHPNKARVSPRVFATLLGFGCLHSGCKLQILLLPA